MTPDEFIAMFAPRPPEPPKAPGMFDKLPTSKVRLDGLAYEIYGQGGLEEALSDVLDNFWEFTQDTYGLAIEILGGIKRIDRLSQEDWSKLDELVTRSNQARDRRTPPEERKPDTPSQGTDHESGIGKHAAVASSLQQILGRQRRMPPPSTDELSLSKRLRLRGRLPEKGQGTPEQSQELSWWYGDGGSGLTDPNK